MLVYVSCGYVLPVLLCMLCFGEVDKKEVVCASNVSELYFQTCTNYPHQKTYHFGRRKIKISSLSSSQEVSEFYFCESLSVLTVIYGFFI